MAIYDDIAERYDETRGGETRGDEYAAELDRRLPAGEGPLLEVGVGTGVVALGLARRGRQVVGVDVSTPMLRRAAGRLGPVVARGDARRLPVRSGAVAHAVSVWVVQHIDPPQALFHEVWRVLAPGGRYLVCPVNRMPEDDAVEAILRRMYARAEALAPAWSARRVSAGDIAGWAAEAGFAAEVETFLSRPFQTTAEDQVRAIRDRVWPVLRSLGDDVYRKVAGPAVEALESLPDGPITRRAECDVVVLSRSPRS